MYGIVSRSSKPSIAIHLVWSREALAYRKKHTKFVASWLKANDFGGRAGEVLRIPHHEGGVERVVVGVGEKFHLWTMAAVSSTLRKGRYHLVEKLKGEVATIAALGWALGLYQFRKYKTGEKSSSPSLVWPDEAERSEVRRLFDATLLVRDLVNIPAQDLGPAELVSRGEKLAASYEAKSQVIVGEALVKQDFPAIYAVGRAATKARAPRLFDMCWGKNRAPKLTLIGKGVVFDSGGLDIKSAAGMRHMKKDMGGAACALALALLVMDSKLPVRLRVLIPAVENAVSANSYRPGDVLVTRSGKTVEVVNTDAEGRLVLCDALTEALSERPDLLIDFATLTGAARVALGTELPALFASHDSIAREVEDAQSKYDPDPLWRMPLFQAYRRHLESSIADLSNVASIATGGAITAALFLGEFVDSKTPWLHVDTMAWNTSSRPGRPEGGEAFGVRTLFRMLRHRYRK